MTRWGPRLGEEWRRYGSFVSLALLGAWTILQFRTTVLRVPAPLLWLSVLGAFLAGHTFVALRRDRLDVPRVIPAVLLAAVLAGGAFTFGELALSPSRSHLVAVVDAAVEHKYILKVSSDGGIALLDETNGAYAYGPALAATDPTGCPT